MQIRNLAAALAVAILASSTAYAQPKPNDNEVQVGGGFFHTQGADTGNINFDGLYGKFLDNPAVQLGLRQSIQATVVDGGPDTWIATTAPFARYHFLGLTDKDRFVPYLGASIGAVYNKDDIDGAIAPEAGGKFFLNSSTFFTAGYRYDYYFDGVRVGNETSDGNHLVTIGLGFLWGGSGR